MDFEFKPGVWDSHSESMDLLSRAWCNFAVHEAFQAQSQDQSLVLLDNPINMFDNDPKPPTLRMDKGATMDNAERSIPPWKSNDVKSWIWMQQAMHPELNYNSCFRKKWSEWKMILPLKPVPIKKWIKDIKEKRKECKRLQRAEVHAAVSVAGVAAALAAIAAADHQKSTSSDTSKEAAMAAAAALVAAECAKVAEAMGAKREQLKNVIGSAMRGTSTNSILTLTAAATTSLKGAATLKERAVNKNRLSANTPALPIEEKNEFELDTPKCLAMLAKGANLNIETSEGRCIERAVSITLNNEAKVVLVMRKLKLLNAFATKKKSVVLDQYVDFYKDSEGEGTDTCFLIVLTTNRGIIKLDMMNDYNRYRLWTRTINHMISLSTSLTNCYKN